MVNSFDLSFLTFFDFFRLFKNLFRTFFFDLFRPFSTFSDFFDLLIYDLLAISQKNWSKKTRIIFTPRFLFPSLFAIPLKHKTICQKICSSNYLQRSKCCCLFKHFFLIGFAGQLHFIWSMVCCPFNFRICRLRELVNSFKIP